MEDFKMLNDIQSIDLIVLAVKLKKENPDWSKGKALYKALVEMNLPLARSVYGTNACPLFVECNIKRFLYSVCSDENFCEATIDWS